MSPQDIASTFAVSSCAAIYDSRKTQFLELRLEPIDVILINHIANSQVYSEHKGGWIEYSAKGFKNATGIAKFQHKRTLQRLIGIGLVQESKIGTPTKTFYRLAYGR